MRYGTCNQWAEYFEKTEGILIGGPTIRKRLSIARVIGVNTRNRFSGVLYYELDIRETCTDLLVDLPQVDKTGFFEKDGEVYGTVNLWAKKLEISHKTIEKRLKKGRIKPIEGKNKIIRIHDFYPESEVRKACSGLLVDTPQADENGFFEENGIRYGTIPALMKELSISDTPIKSRIKKHSIAIKKGKVHSGNIVDCYPESGVRKACADLLEDLPQADESGFLEQNGVRYGTINAFRKELNISHSSVKSRIKKHSIVSRKGKSKHSEIFDFYPESEVLEVCTDLFEDLPQAGKDGFFEEDGIRYGTVFALKKRLFVSSSTIKDLIAKHSIPFKKGRDKVGRVADFYPEPAVLEACADILAKKSKK